MKIRPRQFALAAAFVSQGGKVDHGAAGLPLRQVCKKRAEASPVGLARDVLGEHAGCVQQGDFFLIEQPPFDWVYERALLCALPPRVWADWGRKMAELVKPGGMLAGYFFFADTPKGPPFGTTPDHLLELLGAHFTLLEQAPADDSLPVFAGREQWMVWQRCDNLSH